MRQPKKRRRPDTWRAVRRCVVFFTAICVVPVLLVLVVTTDQYVRPVRRTTFGRPQFNVEDMQNLSAVAGRLQRRRHHFRRACRQLGLDVPGNDSLHRPSTWEYIVDRKHHLVWCNVFKAASTSWMYNFNILAGYSPKFLKKTKIVPLDLARQKYPRPTLDQLRQAFNDSISFLIVRHPFERLLSAYKDKLEHALPRTLHHRLSKSIVNRYRKDKTKNRNMDRPTFNEFVAYLLDRVKYNQSLDMHWTPINNFCTPCMYDFDIIAHTETLQEDQRFLIEKTRLSRLIEPQWKNAGHGITSKQIEQYYSQLKRSHIIRLYHIYRYDFVLFDYNMNDYLKYGEPDEDPSVLLAAITMKDLVDGKNPKSPFVY